MLNEAQMQVDTARTELYSEFRRPTKTLAPVEIFDMPVNLIPPPINNQPSPLARVEAPLPSKFNYVRNLLLSSKEYFTSRTERSGKT